MRLRHAFLVLLLFVGKCAVANDLSSDEEVVPFPTYSVFDRTAPQTSCFVHGWIFEREADSLLRTAALDAFCKALELTPEERQPKLFMERAAWFLVDNERNQRLKIRIGTREFELPSSEANGHFEGRFELPTTELAPAKKNDDRRSQTVEYQFVVPTGDPRTIRGRIHLLEPEGLSIVSDVDDTIKQTDVLDRAEMIRNTFLRDFKAVPGMAEAYRRWEAAGAAFHYVSGSPWQLSVELEAFRAREKFPPGSWHLRHFRLTDGSAIRFLTTPTDHKLTTIGRILNDFPRRKFIFVGDTGEQDPEVYGELARRHPEQIQLLALRNITAAKIDDARMRRALQGVKVERVLLFEQAEELPNAILAPTK